MMKRILLSLFLFTTVVFSNIVANEKEIEEPLNRGTFYQSGIIIADTTEADTFLELLHKAGGDLSRNTLVLILPDADIVDENVEKLVKRVSKVKLLFLNIKSENIELKNRSMEDLKVKPVYDRLKDYDNLVVSEIVVDEEFLESRIESDGSIEKILDEIYKRLNIERR